jgi:hypothetical protein
MEGIRPISAAISGVSSSDDHELRQCDGSGGKVTDAAWDRIVAGRAVPTSWPGRGPPEPCKPITRERYATDQATAHVFDTAAHVRQKLSLRLASMARSYRVPRECMGVDENPNLNGGRYPTKAKFPTREIFSETTTLKLKDGSQRKVVRQKAAGKLGKFAASTGIPCGDHEDCRITRTLYEFDGLPLYPKKRPRGWQGPELPLYLKWNPTPARHQASPRGDAPPSVIDQWADTPVQSRVRETNQPLKEMRRLATIGRQKYADELVAKDRTKARVNNEIEPAPFITRVAYWISDNTAATAAPVDTERRPQGARTAKTDTQYEWDYPAVVSKKPASKPQHIYTEAIFAHARAKFAGKLRPIPQRDPYRWVELVGGGSVRTVPRNNLDRLAQMAERTNHEKPQRNEPALCGVSLPRIDTGDSPHLWPGHRTSGEPDSVGDDGRHGPRRSSDVQDAH